jgi:predicted protein tyrosine phosphatase
MFRHQIHSAGIVKRLRHAFFVLSAPENTGGSIFKAPYFLLRIRHFWHILPCFYINDGNERAILRLQLPDLKLTHCFEISIQRK